MVAKRNTGRPPRFLELILENIQEYLPFGSLGDFEEDYKKVLFYKGKMKADFWYLTQVMVALISYLKVSFLLSGVMFKNYLKTALRNLIKNKVYSLITVSGLVIGMTCFIIISLFIRYELSYDSFHRKAGRIYRLGQFEEGKPFSGAPASLGPAFVRDFKEVVDCVRISETSYNVLKINIRYGQKSFYESRFFMADPSIFNVFTFPLLKGDPGTVLSDPNSVVITEAMAKKYFGNEEPLGKTLIYDNRFSFTVSGVAEEVPLNSHFHFDFLVSFENLGRFLGDSYLTNWSASNFVTYFLLEENASHEVLLQKAVSNAKKYPLRETYFKRLFLEPLREIHLAANRKDFEPAFDKKYIYLIGSAGLIILFIACINFINLSTARSAKRAKEVSLRKVVGAKRSQLVKQFLSESLLMSLIALTGALILSVIVLHWVNSLAGSKIEFSYFSIDLIIILTVTFLIVGIASGSYPALIVSAFQPATVLKGAGRAGKNSPFMRKLLVVLQFTMSVILIIGTLIMRDQIEYLKNKELGWNRKHVFNIQIYEEEVRRNYEVLKSEFLKLPGVTGTSASVFRPNKLRFRHGARWEGKRGNETTWVWVLYVDHDFIKTFDIDIIDGRDFSRDISTDEKGPYILNEAAVKKIGRESPLGKKFTAFGDEGIGPIIGVVRDFHFRSLHHGIEPILLYINPERFEFLSVRINSVNLSETLDNIENIWEEVLPGKPFNYYFIGEDYDNLYRSETVMSRVIGCFTMLSIFIACLGLLGLAAFMAEQRTKEIGIRKVLGASVSSVILMLSKQYLKWVVIANLIAWPLAYFIVDSWLQNFTYRISVSIWTFFLSGILSMVITFLTVSYQLARAAKTNPVETLQYE